MPGAAGQLKKLYQQIIGAVQPSGSASDTGDISQQIAYLVARAKETVGTVDISPTGDAAGSLAERVAYLQANSTGGKKISGTGIQCVPDAAAGVDPTNGVSWGAGTWIEVVASTAAAIHVLGFTFRLLELAGVTDEEYEIDIGTGAGGSETVKSKFGGTVNHITSAGGQSQPAIWLPFILPVAISTRIAVRARHAAGAGAGYEVKDVKLMFINQADLVAV